MVDENAVLHLKRTAKNSLLYAVGGILRRITGFVMLPIYTHYLTPKDYGVIELITAAIELMGILVGMRITQAMFRYYILSDSQEEKKIAFSTILLTVIGLSGIGVVILAVSAQPLSIVLFGSDQYIQEIRLFSVTLMLNSVLTLCFGYFRVRRKALSFVILNTVFLIIQVLSNILFVVMLQWHVLGVVYSSIVSGSIMSIALLIYVFSKVGLHYSISLARRLFDFVKPLILASLGGFYVAYADKYFLRIFSGISDVGVYSVAGRFSSIVLTAFEVFRMAWGPERFEIVKTNVAKYIYDKVFRFLSAGIILLGSGIAMFAGDVIQIITTPDYYSASKVIPILTAAAIIYVFTQYCNFGIMLQERTRHIAESSLIKAITTTVGSVLLIPYIGIYGAAVISVVSNLLDFFWIYRKSTELYDMELQWRPVRIMILTAVIFILPGIYMPSGELEYVCIRAIIFISLVVGFYKLPLWTVDEKIMLVAPFRKVADIVRISR